MHPIIHHPFAFNVGPLSLTGFGIAVAIAFLTGQFIGQRELVRRGHDPAPMSDVTFAAILGYLLGGKLYYVALHPSWSALFSRSGVVFWGGLLGGIVASWIVIRRRRISFLHMADVAGPAIAAGYAIGRTGCWAVGDDYGRPWTGPFAVAFPQGLPPSTAGNLGVDFASSIPVGAGPNTVLTVHPTQLYEVALGFLMFWALWRMRDHKHAEGWLFGMYCILAGVERFAVEFLRAKDDRFIGPFTTAQAIAFGFIVAGVTLIVRRRSVGPGRPGIHA